MKVLLVAVAAAVLVSGCATTKNWSATGGSRADATVRLSYEYGAFEKLDRPAFRRHPVAIIHGNDRGVYGQQQAVHG